MKYHRFKLHPSSCFPPELSVASTRNRLFIRVAPTPVQRARLTFIGVNSITYSAIAALLVHPQSTSFESIQLFDVHGQREAQATINDLRLGSVLNRTNTRIEWAQSYWETKDSTIIIINVQHHRLEKETLSKWTQINATLVEEIVSQVCTYSPHATLIICTQPNELMTYVASRVSRFPVERVFGLGAGVDTARVHRVILDENSEMCGRVNGFFVLGSGSISDSCCTVFTDELSIDGLRCSDIQTKPRAFNINVGNEVAIRHKSTSRKNWNVLQTLTNNASVYSNVQRRLPISTDLASRQKIFTDHLLANNIYPSTNPFNKTLSTLKTRSNWSEAMLISRLCRALIDDCEFQSNLAVSLAPIYPSKNVFITYPTTIGSNHRGVEYIWPFRRAYDTLHQQLFLVPYEKLQANVAISNHS